MRRTAKEQQALDSFNASMRKAEEQNHEQNRMEGWCACGLGAVMRYNAKNPFKLTKETAHLWQSWERGNALRKQGKCIPNQEDFKLYP